MPRPSSKPSGNTSHSFWSQLLHAWTFNASGNTSGGADDIKGTNNATLVSGASLSDTLGLVCSGNGATVASFTLDGSTGSGYTVMFRATQTANNSKAMCVGETADGNNYVWINTGTSSTVKWQSDATANASWASASGTTTSTDYCFTVGPPTSGQNTVTLFTKPASGSTWTSQGAFTIGGGGIWASLVITGLGQAFNGGSSLYLAGDLEYVTILQGTPPTLTNLNASGNSGFADPYTILVPTSSLAATPTDIPSNHNGNITLTLTGTGTSWTSGGTTFTVSGVSGIAKVSQNVTSGTAATVVISLPGILGSNAAGNTGTLVVSDGTNSSSVTVGLPTLALSPSSGNTGTAPSDTLTGTHTIWTLETASGLFTESGGSGASISNPPTVNSNTSATATITAGVTSGTLQITDTSTGAVAHFTVNSSGAPTSGTFSLATVTLTTALTGNWTAASGGTPGYTYQMRIAPDIGGSPGTFSNAGASTSGLTATVTGLTQGNTYWLKVNTTDAASMTVSSNQVQIKMPTKQVVCKGDSLTQGTGSTGNGNDFPSQLGVMLGSDYAVANFGEGGEDLSAMLTEAATQVDPYYNASNSANICILWAGTNDLYHATSTEAQLQTNTGTWASARKPVGWKNIVTSMMPRNNAGTPGTFENDRTTFNTWLRANWKTIGYDNLCDVSFDSRLGVAGDENNSPPFDGSGVHLNNTGYSYVAQMQLQAVATVVNAGGASGGGGIFSPRSMSGGFV